MQKQHKDFKMAFLAFHLLNVNFRVNEKISLNAKKGIPITSSIGIRHKYEKKSKVLHVFLKVEIKDDNMPFNLYVEGKGVFKFKEAPDESVLRNASEMNCPAIIFPYIRETIADMTRRAGFAPLHLNPVNFVALSHQKSNKNHRAE
jgi:preprotein translocase subunit SecB